MAKLTEDWVTRKNEREAADRERRKSIQTELQTHRKNVFSDDESLAAHSEKEISRLKKELLSIPDHDAERAKAKRDAEFRFRTESSNGRSDSGRATHQFDSSDDAYNEVQYQPHIKNGDTLHIPNERVVGVSDTWPVAVTHRKGKLHSSADWPATVKYLGVDNVMAAVEKARSHGFTVHPDLEKHLSTLSEASLEFKDGHWPKIDVPEPKVSPNHGDLKHISRWVDEVKSFPDFHKFEKSGDYIHARGKSGMTLGSINTTIPEHDAEIDGLEYHEPSKSWVDSDSREGREVRMKRNDTPDGSYGNRGFPSGGERWAFESVESLVDSISSGSAMGIESSFKAIMSRRLLEVIDGLRPDVVSSLVDESGVFQKEEYTTEAKTNGSPATCSHCLKKVKGKGVVHVPPNSLIQLGTDKIEFYHPNCHKKKFPDAIVEEYDLVESELGKGSTGGYGTPGCAGCENDTYNGVCMDCTRARAMSATSRGGCKCGKNKVPGEVKKVGSRSWVPCERCLGQIAQLS